MWTIDIYAQYQKILIYTRQRLIETSADKDKYHAVELYKRRTDDKYEQKLLNKDRKIDNLSSDVKILTQKYTTCERNLRDSKDRVVVYKQISDDAARDNYVLRIELEFTKELFDDSKLNNEMMKVYMEAREQSSNDVYKERMTNMINILSK